MTAISVPNARLLPELTPRQELVLLARTLFREGYDDHLAGHITYKQPDGTLLCNPWLLLWDEIRPADVLRIDLDGNVLEGEWPVPLGIPLHLELHRQRDDVVVSVHNHSRWGTIWADVQRIPPVCDQSSALGGGRVALIDEYSGTVDDRNAARKAIESMGDKDIALLANHGVLITGVGIRAAHQRAVAFEQRCEHAAHVEALGGGRPLPEPMRSRFEASDGTKFIGFWEAMARRELRRDPTLLQ